MVGAATITLAVGGAIDLAAERTRLQAEATEAEAYAKDLATRLSNDQFTAKAPAEVVERERERLADAQARVERIRDLLADIA